MKKPEKSKKRKTAAVKRGLKRSQREKNGTKSKSERSHKKILAKKAAERKMENQINAILQSRK